MPISLEFALNATSSAGGTLGNQLVFTIPGSPANGWLIVAQFEQANPGTAISVDTTGWTTLESVDLGHGVAQWFGYIYWHTGDPTTLPTIGTTQACMGEAYGFSGTADNIAPLHDQRTVATSESPIDSPTIPDTTTSGGNVAFMGVCRYGQVGSGNAFNLGTGGLTDANQQDSSSGGNATDSGTATALGYKISAGSGGFFGPFQLTPRTTVSSTCQAHAFLAVFFTPGSTFATAGCQVRVINYR